MPGGGAWYRGAKKKATKFFVSKRYTTACPTFFFDSESPLKLEVGTSMMVWFVNVNAFGRLLCGTYVALVSAVLRPLLLVTLVTS
jgi:hypothetical protein